MRFRIAAKTSVKVLFVIVFVMLAVSFLLTIFRMAGLFGLVELSLGMDITTLAVSLFLLIVAILAATTTGYKVDEKGVTFRLLFVKINTPLENISAFEYSRKLKVAVVYHAVSSNNGGEDVAQMVVNIDPMRYAEFAEKLKELKNNIVVIPYDDMSKD